MKIKKNKILKNYTTFKVGGKADFFIEAKNNQEIIEGINFAKKKKIPFVVIGNGSNILVNDKGFRGLVIKIKSLKIKVKNNLIIADAGVPLCKIVQKSLENNLTGAEFLAGIPGTLGGAIAGNAGTGKKSISQIIDKVKILKNNKIFEVRKKYFNFRYRDSKIKNNKDIILEAILKLKKSDKKIIIKKIKDVLKKRKKQPTGYSAGSIFKNPGKISAGELIEKSGLKGLKREDAEISEKHGNFIINKKNASAKDIKYLIKKAEKEVLKKFNIKLKREVRYLEEKGWK